MHITHTDIWKFSIPMHPFTIATGTMHYAQNIFIRLHTDAGFYGVGECSAFPMIAGETQSTCFAMAKDFAMLWKGKNPLDIVERMNELHAFTAYNATIKSAFDMALYDIKAKKHGVPLYAMLGGTNRRLETDLTIGIGEPEKMASTARDFVRDGVKIIKIKLGKDALTDIQRVEKIRRAAGENIVLRIDANQGWSFDEAVLALQAMQPFNIQFCEQPMRSWNDHLLPLLREKTTIPIMADESVFSHYDAEKMARTKSCDFINIKFAKSGGILEAIQIDAVCKDAGIPCMMGGMLESRIALSAFVHFTLAHNNIIFYDMDTCLLGHKADPVINGVKYDKYNLVLPDLPGIGADADDTFLASCEKISI